MELFLLILKILGLSIAGILGLVILIICLILFVPIRYRMYSSYYGEMLFEGKISWLLYLISAPVSFKMGKLTYAVKFLFFKLKDSEEESKSKKIKAKKEKVKKEKVKKEKIKNEKTSPDYVLEGFDDNPETENKKTDNVEKDSIETDNIETDNIEADSIETDNKESFFDRLSEFIKKIFDFACNMKQKVSKLFAKLKSVKDNTEYYIDLFGNERKVEVLKKALAIVLGELKKMAPKKLNGQVHFGLEDPGTMGTVLAVLGIIYPIIGNNFNIEPDFEQVVFEGEVFMKGRIYIISLLIAAWKLYFNKELRRVLKDIKKED